MLLTINNSIAQKSKYSLFNILISFNGITTELSDKTLNVSILIHCLVLIVRLVYVQIYSSKQLPPQ